MELDRRRFFETVVAGAATVIAPGKAQASSQTDRIASDPFGMLCDTTTCIGCRKCEFACNREHSLSDRTLEEFEATDVFDTARRMESDSYTVVNRYPNPNDPEKPIYMKVQCMHCLDPGCVSACLVGAFQTTASGAVVYDASKCMGCRYCMVACPFQVPTYEYSDPLTPRVMKCTLCFERITQEGKIPACAEMCPPMALTFGKRSELLEIARQRIAADPDRYIDHIYGEHEVGGTCWLYLASKQYEDLGLLKLGDEPVPHLTETIQHSVFKFGVPPLILYGLLGAVMWASRQGAAESDSTMEG